MSLARLAFASGTGHAPLRSVPLRLYPPRPASVSAISQNSQDVVRPRGVAGVTMRRGRLLYIQGCSTQPGLGATLAALPAPGTHRGVQRLTGTNVGGAGGYNGFPDEEGGGLDRSIMIIAATGDRLVASAGPSCQAYAGSLGIS